MSVISKKDDSRWIALDLPNPLIVRIERKYREEGDTLSKAFTKALVDSVKGFKKTKEQKGMYEAVVSGHYKCKAAQKWRDHGKVISEGEVK